MRTEPERPSNFGFLEKAYMDRYGLTEAATKRQLDSTAVQRVITLLAENSGLLDRTVQDDLERKHQNLAERERTLEGQQRQIKAEMAGIQKQLANAHDIHEQLEQRQEVLQDLEDHLLDLELPESRDRLRLFQIYLDHCQPVTDANRTWWLAGCAAILSGSPLSYPNQGKKSQD